MGQPERQPGARRLDVLDYLRFTAAAAVVLTHYTFFARAAGDIKVPVPDLAVGAVTRYGYLGVELFFLISGFVILNSARGRTARQFAVSRAVRLLPAFWVSLTITAVATFLWGGLVERSLTVEQILANMTMLPYHFGEAPVDRVYWTLTHEVSFYALIFLALLMGLGPRLGKLLPWWSFAVFAATATGFNGVPFLGMYYALFASGALIAEIRHSGPSPVRVGGLLAAYAVVIPLEHGRAAEMTELARGELISGHVSLAITTSFYVLLIATCSTKVAGLRLPSAAAVGALTYPVYLIHNEIGYIALTAWATLSNYGWMITGLAAGAVLYAYAAHRLVERRLHGAWVRFFDGTLGVLIGVVDVTGSRLGRFRGRVGRRGAVTEAVDAAR